MQHFLETNSLYVVFCIILIIWAGISLFLFYLESKLKKLERKVRNLAENRETA